MFSFPTAFFWALLASSGAKASFPRDVVVGGAARTRRTNEKMPSSRRFPPTADLKSDLHQKMLSKAMPVAEFERKYGVSLRDDSSSSTETRHLEGNAQQQYDLISFSGYSIKFAKCQPVQYFSSYAVEMGEHSPMITNDIVVLRLCPSNSCSESADYGCHYNFAEYAMELAEYLNIMLEYAAAKRDYMCDYCTECLGMKNGRRKLEDADQNQAKEGNDGQQQQQGEKNNEKEDGGQQAQEQQEQQQQQQQEEEGQAAQEEQQEEEEQEEDLGNYYKNYIPYACDTWGTYCGEYGDYCLDEEQLQYQQQQAENGDNGNNNNYVRYMDFEDYENYLFCSEIKYNNYAYFVKPRCDGYQGTIKMAIFYDKYCSQYAGNEVSLKNLGMGFRESAFSQFYSSSCVDCSESEYPPYDAASNMCNELHYEAAKCTGNMVYNLFGNDGSSDDSTECSFIESIRFGTYNEVGQFATRYSDGSVAEKMTDAQKIILSITIVLSVGMVIYACYLHHAMTNLLIKSLSHRELLPPSRHQSRQNASQRRTGRRLKKVGNGEPDWDEDDNSGEYA